MITAGWSCEIDPTPLQANEVITFESAYEPRPLQEGEILTFAGSYEPRPRWRRFWFWIRRKPYPWKLQTYRIMAVVSDTMITIEKASA